MKKILFLILSAGIVAHAQTVATNDTEETPPAKGKYPPPVYPTNVRVEANLPYLGDARAEKADLYFPLEMPKGKKLPAILVIHGGGFNDGDKARPREMNIATNLVLQNYVFMSINYKLRRKTGDVTWPQALYDAKAAVRWLRKNSERLQIDPERIGVIGCSAGGNLATMLALTQPQDGFDLSEPNGGVSSAVSCAVDFYGAVDLMNYHDMKMFNKTRAEAPELYTKASPVTYARKDAPPILLVHGTADAVVPATQSQALDAALTKIGAQHELVIVPDAPHTFHLQPKQRDLRPLVFDFFAKNLKGESAAAK